MVVVIATRDRPGMLEGALDAVMAVVRSEDEVVVVDSASRTSSTADVARAAGAPVVRCDLPGASRARNAGVRATGAPLIAVVDDDARPRPGWTARLSEPFGDAHVAFATGRVLTDEVDAASPVVVEDDRERTFAPGDDPMDFGHGTNSAFRRSAFEQVGGYDEALGPGARLGVVEEQDLFWRLLHQGWRGVYTPAAEVEHLAWRNRRDQLRTQWGYGRGSGSLVAKVWRMDRSEAGHLARRRLWDDGLRLAWTDLRRGWEIPALTQLVKVVGVVVGACESVGWSVRDGHYVRRRSPFRRDALNGSPEAADEGDHE